MAIEHQFVNLTAPQVHHDPETLDPIETPKRDAGPVTSFHTAEFSDAEAGSIRDDIIRYNKDQPEILTRKLADFDLAARQDGRTVKPPIDPELAELYRDSGIRPNPSPTDYRPDFGETARNLKPEALGNISTVTTRWAAEIGLSPEMGTTLIERIAADGRALSQMTPEQKAQWKDRQESLALKIAGSKGALIELKEKASAVLALAKPFEGPTGREDFSGALHDSLAFNDPQILTLLATHHDLVAELRKAGKK